MMLSAARIKFIASLSQKKYRDSEGLFVVEGEKLVQEALASDFGVEAVYRKEEIGEAAMKRISSLATPSPVLAVVRKPSRPTLSVLPDRGLFLALDGIRDPGNLGTILRVADWFGLDGVYASPDTVDLFNPKVVQATMGAIFRVPFLYTDLPVLCRGFVSAGAAVYGTFLDGRNLYGSPLSVGREKAAMIVIGNEAKGISDVVASCVTERIFIPPYPAGESGSESLNAAVAAAITVAEFRRRYAL